ncbi:MAG: hypothetical protein M5R42_14080 [Rhodocyclaceae bacterium]|nr:hypothetical protein [Rhodocyclaceae bacterium]
MQAPHWCASGQWPTKRHKKKDAGLLLKNGLPCQKAWRGSAKVCAWRWSGPGPVCRDVPGLLQEKNSKLLDWERKIAHLHRLRIERADEAEPGARRLREYPDRC